MRAFIGISLEASAKGTVIKLQEGLAKSGLKGNFTAKSNIHLTLEFLGEVNPIDLGKIKEIFDNLDFHSFVIEIKKLTALKDMMILEIEKSNDLMDLQSSLRKKLKENGLRIDDRPYYPHITLIREASGKLEKNLSVKSRVDSVILFESKRELGKLVYEKVYEKSFIEE